MTTNKKVSVLDSPLFVIVIILCVIGIVMVYSASSFKAQDAFGDSNYFMKRHFYKVILSLVVLLAISKIKYQTVLTISPALLLIGFILLIYILLSPGIAEIRGSKRWINLGLIHFQPSDFARIALILFLSLSLGAAKTIKERSVENFIFHLGIIGAIVLPIFLQPDAGSALLTMLVALTILFIAGEPLKHLTFLIFATVPFLTFSMVGGGYRTQRLLGYIASLKGSNVQWQAQQSLIAFGNGHFFGQGLGASRQKYHFLPDPFTDFIFAIFGEELGLVGSLLIVGLFVAFVWHAFNVAGKTKDFRARILIIGLTFNIAIYAFTNMAVVLNLLPTTGVPLPFVSYGGSALFTNMASVGIILNIAKQCETSRRRITTFKLINLKTRRA